MVTDLGQFLDPILHLGGHILALLPLADLSRRYLQPQGKVFLVAAEGGQSQFNAVNRVLVAHLGSQLFRKSDPEIYEIHTFQLSNNQVKFTKSFQPSLGRSSRSRPSPSVTPARRCTSSTVAADTLPV